MSMVTGHTNQEVKRSIFSTRMFRENARLGTPVRNKDNNGQSITDPSKSDFSPWTEFCYYFIAQPSKLKIN